MGIACSVSVRRDLRSPEAIAKTSLREVYAAGHRLRLRPDWEGGKLRVMLEAPYTRRRLVAATYLCSHVMM